ncbi:TPA: hypothetical protein SMP26_001858 [Proteus mirabilis]|nr:hypothetical protein [Proteus mirabilis]
MARPVKFTREMIVEIAKQFYSGVESKGDEFFKHVGIDRSGFYKLMKKYNVKVKVIAEVY